MHFLLLGWGLAAAGWLYACTSRKADGVAYVLRRAARVDRMCPPQLLLECRDWFAWSVATASAACERKPHHPP